MTNQGPFSLDTFLTAAEGKAYDDVILLADSEATAAERRRLRLRKAPIAEQSLGYAVQLKALIHFLRYGVKPKGLSVDQLARIQRLRGQALKNKAGRLARPKGRLPLAGAASGPCAP